jgi:hypothetical protein
VFTVQVSVFLIWYRKELKYSDIFTEFNEVDIFFLFYGNAKKLTESDKIWSTTASLHWRHFRKGPHVTEDAARKFESVGTGAT